MKTPPKIHLILFIINFIYAINYIIAKEIIPGVIGPLAMMFFRALGAIVFFTTLSLFSPREVIARKDWTRLAVCALFGIAINGMLFLKGIALTLPINASLIMILVPIIVLVLSYFFFKERIGVYKLVGSLIGLFGAYALITKFEPLQFSSKTLIGDLFILLNGISFSIYLLLAKELLRKYSAVTMAKWLFTIGILYIIPFSYRQLTELDLSIFEVKHFAAFAFVIIFPTCIAYYFYCLALKKVSASIASSYIFLQPLITAIFALALGKDYLDMPKIVGGVCILIGVFFVNFSKKTKGIKR